MCNGERRVSARHRCFRSRGRRTVVGRTTIPTWTRPNEIWQIIVAQKIDPPLALELRVSTVDGKQVLSMSARRAISVAFDQQRRARLCPRRYFVACPYSWGKATPSGRTGSTACSSSSSSSHRSLGPARPGNDRLLGTRVDTWRRGAHAALMLVEDRVTELETLFRAAADRDKPAYAAALREIYTLYIRRAGGHYASSSTYQSIRQRVLAGLLENPEDRRDSRVASLVRITVRVESAFAVIRVLRARCRPVECKLATLQGASLSVRRTLF